MDQQKAPRVDGVTYDQAMRAAADLVPLLKDEAAQGDEQRSMPDAVAAELRRTGLLRFLQPKAWGGMELEFVSWVDIPEMLARGDCSVAWNVANLASHHRTLSLFSDEAQREVWEDDPDALIASGIAYQFGRAKKVDGGYQLSGKWPFCSAVVGAKWNILAAIVMEDDKPVDWVQCLLPEGEYEVLDDWHTLGMRGTGSNTCVVSDLFVPEHRVESMAIGLPGHNFRGVKANPNPMYRIPTSALGASGLAGCVIGASQAALDAMIEWIKVRSTNYTGSTMRDFQTVQLRIGMAGARIDAARLILRNDCLEAEKTALAGEPVSIETRLRYKRNICLAARMATEATEMLFEMAGANGIYDTSPMQRIYRDVKSASTHIHFSTDMQMTTWGNVALGGEFKSPTM
ncbi:MAG: acyl-CoA dehydrogenase [Rhizobiales bacterium]|nr:acyl-CoA dehydrogenase [Hyphomicrobiales bacterium]